MTKPAQDFQIWAGTQLALSACQTYTLNLFAPPVFFVHTFAVSARSPLAAGVMCVAGDRGDGVHLGCEIRCHRAVVRFDPGERRGGGAAHMYACSAGLHTKVCVCAIDCIQNMTSTCALVVYYTR